MNTDTQLPPPSEKNHSHATITIFEKFANAAVMRPGDGFTIEASEDGEWVRFEFGEDLGNVWSPSVSVSVAVEGVPALISELQRLLKEVSDA